ncbi:MAG: hypothetical protein ACE14V_13290 [bacterium]
MPKITTFSKTELAALGKEYGGEAKLGKISVVRGKYYITVDEKKQELDPNYVVASKPLGQILKKGIGGKVVVIIIGGIIVVIIIFGPRILRPPRILCYIPVPRLRVKIDSILRAELVNQLVEEKILEPALAKKILNEIKR